MSAPDDDDKPKPEESGSVDVALGSTSSLPVQTDGTPTPVGDMDSALLGGQRQRIILARALYRDPDALFLDEGTANLDEENEVTIADMIARLPITRVIIAHRPALVERADHVWKMENGRLTQVRGPRLVAPQRAIIPAF